jgi:mediator of RNA polymerase II transcription subunit 21
MRQLAQDLVVKEQQIEALVAALPGVGISQAQQETRIRRLQRELVGLERESRRWDEERARLMEMLEARLVGVKRI